jgi:hypothetical protein
MSSAAGGLGFRRRRQTDTDSEVTSALYVAKDVLCRFMMHVSGLREVLAKAVDIEIYV